MAVDSRSISSAPPSEEMNVLRVACCVLRVTCCVLRLTVVDIQPQLDLASSGFV